MRGDELIAAADLRAQALFGADLDTRIKAQREYMAVAKKVDAEIAKAASLEEVDDEDGDVGC